MENSRYVINKEFLDVNRYRQVVDETMNYEHLFKSWLGQIVEYYRGSVDYENIAANLAIPG